VYYNIFRSIIMFSLLCNFSFALDGGGGLVQGHAVVIEMPDDDVQKLINPNLELKKHNRTNKNTHQVLLLFFSFKNVGPIINNRTPKIGLNYNSLYFLIPHVGFPWSAHQHYSVLPIGLMSSRLMTYASSKFSGLNKIHTNIIWDKSSFTCNQWNNLMTSKLLVVARFNQLRLAKKSELTKVINLVNMPILSDKPRGSGFFGTSSAKVDWDNSELLHEHCKITFTQRFFQKIENQKEEIKKLNYETKNCFYFNSTFSVGKFTPL